MINEKYASRKKIRILFCVSGTREIQRKKRIQRDAIIFDRCLCNPWFLFFKLLICRLFLPNDISMVTRLSTAQLQIICKQI